MYFEVSKKLEEETAFCALFLKYIICFVILCIMSSAIMDFFVDKIISFSAKMKEESSKFSGPSYLMSVNSNYLSHQLSQVDMCNALIGDTILKGETSNQIVPLKQPLGYLTGNYFSFRNPEKSFLHPSNNLVMDIYRHSLSLPEPRFLSHETQFSQLVNSFCNQFSDMNRIYKTGVEMNKPSPSLVTETDKAVSETHSPVKKKCELTTKFTIPNTLMLNKELASRKTKEMHKRSKKRRRRQKKSQQCDNNSIASVSDDDVGGSIPSSLTSVYVASDNAKLGCTVALSHSLKMTSNILSSFVVSVTCASDDDDSEWESYEAEQVDSICQKSESDLVSNLPPSKNSKCSQPVNCSNQKANSFLSSFIVSFESSTDDESDWDSCDTEIFPETPEFEFTGLFVTSLCTSQTPVVDPCNINIASEDEETVNLRIHLQEVNKLWNKSSEGLESKPKLPSKVSFAPDEVLTEVFPVETYERKGEWEIYATERIRFKRKIDELEKILSPCFHPDHRSKVFKKITEAVL